MVLRTLSSTSLGGVRAVAVRALAQQMDDSGLEVCRDGVETQPASGACGARSSAKRCPVADRCAAVTSVT